tara:strand:+ start:1162 stop:1389 length:228 start_codon:yes stop_codon:yes gene_type:complete
VEVKEEPGDAPDTVVQRIALDAYVAQVRDAVPYPIVDEDEAETLEEDKESDAEDEELTHTQLHRTDSMTESHRTF